MHKLLAAGTIVVALVAIADVAASTAVTLTLVLVTTAVMLREAWRRVAAWPLAASGVDGLWLAVGTLALTFPVAALAMPLARRWDLSVLAAIVALLMLGRWRRATSGEGPHGAAADPGEAADAAVPASVYWMAAGYVVWSVAAPFGHFNEHSLVREMYTDGFQRFGVVHALMEHVPPRNPFVDGMPLRYYWFSLAPIAALASTTGASPFDAWKVMLTWQAFAFVIALWWVARSLTGQRSAAWCATLLAVALPSAEILWHPSLDAALPLGTTPEQWPQALALLTSIDPDHAVGVLVPHSDQLLMEDFLYIPQNAAALALLLATVWLSARGRWLAAGWAVALAVGTNTFFAIPGGLALVGTVFAVAGPARAAVTGGWIAAWGLTWAGLCRITPGSPLLVVVAGLVLAGAAWAAWQRLGAEPRRDALTPAGRLAGIAVLLTLGALLWQRPLDVRIGLAANYGLALALGLVATAALVAGRFPGRVSPAPLFLCGFVAAFFLTTNLLVAPFWNELPGGLADLLFRVGDLVNPFNFYHKAAKGVRVAWCLLAASVAAPIVFWVRGHRARLALTVVAGGVLVPVLAATTVLRPLTYLRDEPGAEAPAAALLRAGGATLETVVLLEDYRWSRINQLAPVSTYFISSWSGGARTLSNAAGTWADQYVPTRLGPAVAARERRNHDVFAAADIGAAIARLREETRIDYVLTRRRLDLGPAFIMLVDWPGGYLYRVAPDASPERRLP